VVTPHDVRDFLGAVTNINDPAEKGIFITTNGFTLEAEKTAQGNPRIELIDGIKLVRYWRMAFGKAAPEKAPVAGSVSVVSSAPLAVAPAPVTVNTCPRCGGELVLRIAKKGTNGQAQTIWQFSSGYS
jgi:restriction system protein